MPTITTSDGTEIFHKDWGEGQPVVFSHGWPLNADAWESQMLFLAQNGYRAIAHDRRGHGRSGQPWHGNDMDTYADDLADLFERLDVRDAIMVGHSTGGGEVARYIGRHGTSRVKKAVLMGAVPPIMPMGSFLRSFLRSVVRAGDAVCAPALSAVTTAAATPAAPSKTALAIRPVPWRPM